MHQRAYHYLFLQISVTGEVLWDLKEIVGKVVEFPPDIENRNDYAAKIYKEMKVKAESHKMLMARKLWLSNNVKGKKKGEVYWFVETKPRVMITGRLLFTELEEDFDRNK
jgi:hypothetical protein